MDGWMGKLSNELKEGEFKGNGAERKKVSGILDGWMDRKEQTDRQTD